MRRRSDGRVKAWVNGALAMVVAPLLATAGSGPVGGTPGPTATAGGPTATFTATPSRSGPRIALLDHVDPETFLAEVGTAGEVRLSGPKGTRVWTASAMSDTGIPVAAERAYRRAAAAMATTDPECRLPWTLLAGVGRVESDHGRYDGSRLGSDGISRPRIIGVQLNGAGPVAAIRDTDAGKLDGDRIWDRAVGPMQFIPSTWSSARRDGDDDGRRDPHDLDDAAAAAASYLCSGSGSMLMPGAQAAAIHRYNQDDYYVALVQAFEVGYRTGVFVMPPPPVEVDEVARKRRPKRRVVGGDGDGDPAGTITRTRLAPSPASS
ncbi:MAG: lytic murein transglycosylase, partial [Nocardioidaceae bacterium]